jgi:pyrroloquinoline-quinone synthase
MGFGGLGGMPHAQIYREMMVKMGVVAESEPPLPSTSRLIDAMLENCRNPDPAVGLSALCLGAEAIVPHIYQQIVDGFRARGEPVENLDFFRLHIEEDDKHAQTMRRIIEKMTQDFSKRDRIKETAKQILEARARFFDALSSEASEKWQGGSYAALQFA